MKYSLQSLMIVMLLAAIFAAWWGDHRRLTKENQRLADEIESLRRYEVKTFRYPGPTKFVVIPSGPNP